MCIDGWKPMVENLLWLKTYGWKPTMVENLLWLKTYGWKPTMVENLLWLKTYGWKLHIKTKDKDEQTLFLSHRQTFLFLFFFFFRLKLVAEDLHLVFHFARTLGSGLGTRLQGLVSNMKIVAQKHATTYRTIKDGLYSLRTNDNRNMQLFSGWGYAYTCA